MVPNAAEVMLPEGFAKLGWFSTLKTSIRHSTIRDSVNGVALDSERSTFCCPGPVKTFRDVLPHSWPAPTKAALSKYALSLLSVGLDSVADSTVAPGAQLARDEVTPNKLAPLESVMLNGEPLCTVDTPLTCHPLKNFLPKVESFSPKPHAGIA